MPSIGIRVWWGLSRDVMVATWRETWWFPPSTLALSSSMNSPSSWGRWSQSAKPAPTTSRILILARTSTWWMAAGKDPCCWNRRSLTQSCSPRPSPIPGAQSLGWKVSDYRRWGVGGGDMFNEVIVATPTNDIVLFVDENEARVAVAPIQCRIQVHFCIAKV